MPNTVSGAATSAETLTAVMSNAMRSLAALFTVARPVGDERAIHRLLLAAALGLGTLIRFWGLGSFGLQGDEETMAMAALHIVQDGRPILPSGMFYPRGLTELYMMAASVRMFGQSEWALRLPSVLCGIALIFAAHRAGRRFLRPDWNVALAMIVALLPTLFDYSQTARMYIFMELSVAISMACVFAWEGDGRIRWLIAAAAMLIVGIELHALSVTCVLLLLMPAILQHDARKYMYGLAAACVVMIAYLVIDGWVNAQYPVPPPDYAADLPGPPDRSKLAAESYSLAFDVAIWAVGVTAGALAIYLGRKVPVRPAGIVATSLLLAGLVAQLALYYHVAALLAVAGIVVAYRYTGRQLLRRLSMFALASAMLALIHVVPLAARQGSVIKLVGALVGQPSIWPYWRIAEFSMVGWLLMCLVTAWGLWRIASKQRVPDYWLLVMLGVWIPLFVIGFFLWNVPSRYTAASLLPMVLAVCAFAQHCSDWLSQRIRSGTLVRSGTLARVAQIAAPVIAVALIAEPATTLAAIRNSDTRHPDHRGAAEFIRSLQLGPDDITLAEDVLQQTYYLGQVDYWLISRKYARRYVTRVDGRIRDFYTGTPVVDSGAALERVLREHAGKRIYVIGSGENRSDGRRLMRGFGIGEVLKSERFEPIFLGRDGFTQVWRARPQPDPSGSESSISPEQR